MSATARRSAEARVRSPSPSEPARVGWDCPEVIRQRMFRDWLPAHPVPPSMGSTALAGPRLPDSAQRNCPLLAATAGSMGLWSIGIRLARL